MSHNVTTTLTFRDPARLYDVVAKAWEKQAYVRTVDGSNRTLAVIVDNDNLQALIADIAVIDKLPDVEHAA